MTAQEHKKLELAFRRGWREALAPRTAEPTPADYARMKSAFAYHYGARS